MPKIRKLMRTEWYPRPHHMEHKYMHGLETGVVNNVTNYPVIMYDEGLGAASAYNAHPEHSSFSETGGPNCFPQSRVNNIFCQVTFSLTKAAIETDNLHNVKVGYMPVFFAFLEDYTALDEKSTLVVSDVLEMQTESTDRQGYPLYNGVDMVEPYAGVGTLGTNVPGLTGTQKIEGVAWSNNVFYDSLQYYTNEAKIRSVIGGMKWITLTQNRPFHRARFRIRPSTKRMNPYTYFGIITNVPKVDSFSAYNLSADTTNINHVQVSINCRYNEWNQDFDFGMV